MKHIKKAPRWSDGRVRLLRAIKTSRGYDTTLRTKTQGGKHDHI